MIRKFHSPRLNIAIFALAVLIAAAVTGLTGCALPENQTAGHNSPAVSGTAAEPESSVPSTGSASSGASGTSDSPAAQSNADSEAFFGKWTIERVLAYGSAGTYGTDAAQSLVGKSLTFSADRAACFGDQLSDVDKVIENPVYRKETLTGSDFAVGYRMTLDKLGITAPSVTEVTVSDSGGSPGCTFLIKDDNTLVAIGGGTYFELQKAAE